MASEDFPKTLVEFDERFGIEEACQAGLRHGQAHRDSGSEQAQATRFVHLLIPHLIRSELFCLA